jgi:hypothetical protein
MTEAVSPSYESIQQEAKGPGVEEWRHADKLRADLTATYHSLREDPRYTEEHKAERAWERYETAKEKIAADSEKARELLEKRVISAERLSIPFPAGEGLITTDTNKLLASQNEATRIVRKVERKKLKPTQAREILREEYERGLEIGGIQGGAICRGVCQAADELTLDIHSVVHPFRKERHHESLEQAQHAARLTQLISRHIPEPPYPRPNASGSSRDNLFIPQSRGQMFKRSRPSWK